MTKPLSEYKRALELANRVIKCARRTKKNDHFEHITKGPVEEGAVILKSDEAMYFAQALLQAEEMLEEAHEIVRWHLEYCDAGNGKLSKPWLQKRKEMKGK